MDITGVKIRPVFSDFFDRLFCHYNYQADSAYYVEITRCGETFLFPCIDETQQRLIVRQIEDYVAGVSGVLAK